MLYWFGDDNIESSFDWENESLKMSLMCKKFESKRFYNSIEKNNTDNYGSIQGNESALLKNFSETRFEDNWQKKKLLNTSSLQSTSDKLRSGCTRRQYVPPPVFFTKSREAFTSNPTDKFRINKPTVVFSTLQKNFISSTNNLVNKNEQFSGAKNKLENNYSAMVQSRNNSYQFNNYDQMTMSAGAGNYDNENDIFVNYNESIEQLPDLQRELGKRLRRHLQFFFMNPLQKYRIRQQFPFKLILQILKVLFITIQLVLFAEMRISHVDFLDDSVTVMRHKFLKEWNNDRDEVVYPPDSGKYAVYSSDQIIEHFAFIVKSYYSIQNESFASFSYDTTYVHHKYRGSYRTENDVVVLDTVTDFHRIPPIKLCRDRIANVSVQNDTYVFDISEVNECFLLNFTQSEVEEIQKNEFAIRKMLLQRNITFNPEDALIMSKTSIIFNLRTIHFSPLSTDQKPECYLIKVVINFDNSRHTGQVLVKLNSIISYVNLCNGRVLQVGSVGLDTVLIGIIDALVLLMCLSSFALCCRALIKAHLLKVTTCDFFDNIFKRRLTVKDQFEFFNMWYVMIVINDVLIVLGTVFKVSIEFRDFDSDLFTLTGILLGLGALLVYIGLLRYLGFFNQYNILVLTLKRSLPSILRFMVCTIILYMGFLIAGWVIIGPYSIKFRTLSQSSEALFSLLNGDDMFATFYTISDTSTTINVVGTIYIYVFVCLFIYVVLSLFIAIIMDAYEVVKERYNQGLEVERSTLYEFLASADSPIEGSSEARELFAADRLLRLDESWLLQNWSEIRDSLRHAWHARNGENTDVRSDETSRRHSSLIEYRSFENPINVGENAPLGTQSGNSSTSSNFRDNDLSVRVDDNFLNSLKSTVVNATTFNQSSVCDIDSTMSRVSSFSPSQILPSAKTSTATFSIEPSGAVRLSQFAPHLPTL